MKASNTLVFMILFVISACADMAEALPINQVSPDTLTGTGLITFDDVSAGNYDSIIELDGADFGERFLGQTLTTSGDFDVLSGSPTDPLSLAVGNPGQNLDVWSDMLANSHILLGLGPQGFAKFDAIGEGSFAVLFDADQSELGFDLYASNGGSAYIDFFRRDGSLIQSTTLTLSSPSAPYLSSYAFARDEGMQDIAGFSIYNDDPAGIGFDNLMYGVSGIPEPVPEPSTMLLLGSGLVGAIVFGRKKISKR